MQLYPSSRSRLSINDHDFLTTDMAITPTELSFSQSLTHFGIGISTIIADRNITLSGSNIFLFYYGFVSQRKNVC